MLLLLELPEHAHATGEVNHVWAPFYGFPSFFKIKQLFNTMSMEMRLRGEGKITWKVGRNSVNRNGR
jgi:hypothetical protein